MNKDLRRDYLDFLYIQKIYNAVEYTIQNKNESCAFFLMHNNKLSSNNLLNLITSPKYSFYCIKHVKDIPRLRDNINQSRNLLYKTLLAQLDGEFSDNLQEKIIKSKKYKLIKILSQFASENTRLKINDFVLNSNKSLYLYDILSQVKNKQFYIDKLISLHKKTYIFKAMSKYPNLDYIEYEYYLLQNDLQSDMKKYLKIKYSEQLENYLFLS